MLYVEPFKDPEAAKLYIRDRVVIAESGCWEWQMSTEPEGYGTANIEGRHLPAHRASILAEGALIPHLFPVDHLCRNRACVNPEHLEVVSVSENVQRGLNVTERRGKPKGCKKHGMTDGAPYYYSDGKVLWHCTICRQAQKERKKS